MLTDMEVGMLDNIRKLINEVTDGDISKLEAIDVEFEKLVREGNDAELENGMKLLEEFLFAQSQINFEEDQKAA
jgi:hypothetical protein